MERISPYTMEKNMFETNHLEKYESQWKGLARIYVVENKKCSKPPTSLLLFSKHLFQSHLYLERWKCGAPRF
jgi:hypothetical protein